MELLRSRWESCVIALGSAGCLPQKPPQTSVPPDKAVGMSGVKPQRDLPPTFSFVYYQAGIWVAASVGWFNLEPRAAGISTVRYIPTELSEKSDVLFLAPRTITGRAMKTAR